ncbi:solute carrier family 35 member F5-like [Orbicella faveolata]|uniref:solute carrier family 35 member F5-like n=1 Tax=Orbicella faveolata TaxID=48498 RepID=UPI0009E5CA9A|nr:solute carrier family 35 member F5-like [Orbicella faveolata]
MAASYCRCARSIWMKAVCFIVSDEEGIRRKRRLVWGLIVLLLVDVIWVGSAELTDFIFKDEGFNKPFFTTYVKTSSFMIYLTGFIFYEPWRLLCIQSMNQTSSKVTVSVHQAGENSSLLHSPSSSRESSPVPSPLMHESAFEQVTDDELSNSQLVDVESGSFEIIQNHNSEQARLARCPYQPSELGQKLSLMQVAKIAVMFCFLVSEQMKDCYKLLLFLLLFTGLFTLILASIFQSSTSDKFSVTKLLAVLMSITGIVLVTLSDSKNTKGGISLGALWALAGAFLYSCYLILLKRKVPNEEQMDIPMFFGLVGAFIFSLLWPGFFVLNYFSWEKFELPPSSNVWGYIVLNAIVGTVLSEVLWLWGCYLTSSLTATLSLSLVIPLTMIVDVFMKKVHFSWMFFIGTIPAFVSFFAVGLLTHYGDWDPILVGLKKLVNISQQVIERRRDAQQTESLINNVIEEEADQGDTGDDIKT